MGAIAQSLPVSNRRLAWLWEFLRNELAPYRGRGALVARMVIASTLVMILCMTFKIPYGAYAALFAITISRESIEGTASAARAIVVGSALGGAYVIVGLMLILGNAMLRFLWVGATFFLVFYAISALSDYAASARFAYLVVIIVPVTNSEASAESKLVSTLWAVGAITLGSVITLLMEMAFAAFRRTDELTEAIAERLEGVEELLGSYLEDRPEDAAARPALARLASVGTSRLRRILRRANYAPQREQQMGAVVALVGRLVDIAANLAQFNSSVTDDDRNRVREVVLSIGEIRSALTSGTALLPDELPAGDDASGVLLLGEVEKTVSLLHEVLTGAQVIEIYPLLENSRPGTALVRGALSNPEHVKFALRGALAASLSFFIFNSLFWPGISTAVTTCLLTALSTVGASHQKQFLRFSGALVGGLLLGMGAQIFILPNIDSIGAFAVLIAVVAALSSWIATSGPRLSYFGVQVVVAFYLINLQEFKIQTSLTVARDRVVGILLGLLMMWLAFDLLWSTPAGVEMKKAFIGALRLLAQLAREPVSKDVSVAIERSYTLRESINTQFDKVRSLADGVLFEFGPSRQQDLALRDHVREWQPQLQTLFLMRIAFLKYRLQLPGFELPEAVQVSQQEYDSHSARVLEDLADQIESNSRPPRPMSEDSLGHLEQVLRACRANEQQPVAGAHVRSFMTLLSGIDALTTSLAEAITMEFDRTALL
jgi:multidrug resistance protein MdtO